MPHATRPASPRRSLNPDFPGSLPGRLTASGSWPGAIPSKALAGRPVPEASPIPSWSKHRFQLAERDSHLPLSPRLTDRHFSQVAPWSAGACSRFGPRSLLRDRGTRPGPPRHRPGPRSKLREAKREQAPALQRGEDASEADRQEKCRSVRSPREGYRSFARRAGRAALPTDHSRSFRRSARSRRADPCPGRSDRGLELRRIPAC
jgi:hypothetical protein